MSDVRPFRSIPILGEPTVDEVLPIVMARCACGKGTPMLIQGVTATGRCDGCGAEYAIHDLHCQRGAQGVEIRLSLMRVTRMAPAGAPV